MMNKFRLFTIAGIPVITDWMLLVFAAVLTLFWGLVAIPMLILLFGSVVFHEYGHALTARKLYGADCPFIYLIPLGGMAMIDANKLDTPKKEAVVAVAGPVASLTLALSASLLYSLTGSSVLFFLAAVNLMLGVFNLLPIFPMDGGRLLKCALWWHYDNNEKATRKVSKVGFFGAATLGFIALLGGYIWLTVVMAFVAYLNYGEAVRK